MDLTNLARRHAELRVVAVLRHRVAPEPAERTSCAPLPFRISMLWIIVPSGMCRSGIELPGLMSALRLESTASPTLRPSGATM